MPARPDVAGPDSGDSSEITTGILDLNAHKQEVAKAAEMLVRFYGPKALAQAEKLEQRLKGSIFARHVREALTR